MLSYKEKYMKASLRVCLKAFPMRFKNMPTSRAFDVLLKLGHGNEIIWWVSYDDSTKRHEWSVERLSDKLDVLDCFPLARQLTHLEFFGGPTSAMRIYKGTLLSLLMDRLLTAMDHVGFKALDAVIPLSESYTPGGKSWQ